MSSKWMNQVGYLSSGTAGSEYSLCLGQQCKRALSLFKWVLHLLYECHYTYICPTHISAAMLGDSGQQK